VHPDGDCHVLPRLSARNGNAASTMHVRVASRSRGSTRRSTRVNRYGSSFNIGLATAVTLVLCAPLAAHNGPPFPVVTDRASGSCGVFLWADRAASDGGAADARFWVMVNPAAKGTVLPADTV